MLNGNQPYNYGNCLQAVLPIYLVSAHLWYSGRGYAFTIGIGCCGGLFFKKQADDQLDRTPQDPPPDPPVGQILEFGHPDRCSPLRKLCLFWMEHSVRWPKRAFWDIFLL